jgi:hypothetical protein
MPWTDFENHGGTKPEFGTVPRPERNGGEAGCHVSCCDCSQATPSKSE